MTNAVKVPAPVRRAMITHARSTYPEEACGLVQVRRARICAWPTASPIVTKARTASRWTPAEHYRTIRHAERRGWEVVGVFPRTRTLGRGRRLPMWRVRSTRSGVYLVVQPCIPVDEARCASLRGERTGALSSGQSSGTG